jgi:FkbM family methyltransferase
MLGKLARLYMAGPEHPAKGRVVRWLGRRVLSERGVIGEAYPGVRMWLHPADWIELQLLRGIRYAPLTLDFLAANLRPGDTAILAGINNGLHAIVSARAVGATGRVIGCEPQPAALLRTRANVAQNDLPPGSLTLVAAALGSAPALTRLPWPPPHNRGAASFFAAGDGFVAPVVTLSEVARAQGVGRLRLLLLVVQGCEELALAGLGDLSPEIVIVANDAECAARAGRSRADLHARLRRLGFTLHDARGAPFDAAGAELPEDNIFCVRPRTTVRWSRD